jgi:hypothetical protein
MQDVQPWQVKLFLFQFKEFAQNNFSFYPREESIDTIARLGITIPQAKNEILELTYENYYRGPIQDTDSRKRGEYWEFGRLICGKEIFIKLKTVSEYGAAICFSFHIPEKQIKYPFKRREEEK